MIARANDQALERLTRSNMVLRSIRPARAVIPGMHREMILHAGPPICWERMCGPMQGAVIGALIYEGLAKNEAEAKALAASGRIEFDSCHHHQAVGPMAGVLSPSMWVFCVENETYGNTAYCSLNEGLGKVLRFGAYDASVIERLRWMAEELAPTLNDAILASGGINIKTMIAQALCMGDEGHNRNFAGTNLFLKEILPHLLGLGRPNDLIIKIVRFISNNGHFFLNLSMPAAKAAADTILDIEGSSLMCAMARNGVEIGIRVAGCKGQWYTAPSGMPKGLYFPGFSEADANPDIGDSTICETGGFGAFAMAAAPAIVKFVGGRAEDAVRYNREMYEITWGKHPDFQIPPLDFMGTPAGVDIRKVVEFNLTPIINTGIAHKNPGIGQVGAGILRAPLAMFQAALKDFHARYVG
jgi:hypothetical protein